MSVKKYQDYSCNELEGERDNVQSELMVLTASMESKSSNDTGMVVVGMLLFFITLFFVKGKNPADDLRLAQLKGEIKAIDKAMITCSRESQNLNTEKELDKESPSFRDISQDDELEHLKKQREVLEYEIRLKEPIH